jgi:DoxX-like family
MGNISMGNLKLLRFSLVVVWLITGLVSLIELRGQSAALLLAAGMTNPAWIDTLIWSGAALDAALGLALWLIPRKSVYWCALLSMLLMTVIATLLSPSLWLHPLGPLLKNIPLAAMFWVLIQSTNPHLEMNKKESL